MPLVANVSAQSDLIDGDALAVRCRHRQHLAGTDQCEAVESIGVVDPADSHHCDEAGVPDRGRLQLNCHIAGLAGFAGREQFG